MTIFTKIIERELPADIVLETDTVLAFKDINPQAPVHVLVIPKKPLPRLSNAGAEDSALLGELLSAAREVAEREGIAGSGYRVVINNGDHILVNLPGGLTFESGSVDLSEDARSTIARLAGSLNRYPNSLIDAIGHTDGSGPADANQALSARRAQTVTNVLTQYGVGYDRIRSYGRGEWEPIARNDTEYGRSLNRRVEILIYPQQ